MIKKLGYVLIMQKSMENGPYLNMNPRKKELLFNFDEYFTFEGAKH